MDNNYLDLGTNKGGFVHTLSSGRVKKDGTSDGRRKKTGVVVANRYFIIGLPNGPSHQIYYRPAHPCMHASNCSAVQQSS
jgi:hypothetical protein